MWRYRGLALFVLTLVASAAQARDIFVDNTLGDDASSGRFSDRGSHGDGPVQSLGRALAISTKGDRVVMANTGMPYRESVTLQAGRNTGNSYQPFLIEGNGATLDGSEPVPPDAWEHYHGDVFRFQPKYFSHQELFLDGVPVDRRHVGPDGEFPDLQPLEWCYFGRYIYFRPEQDLLPDAYNLSHSALPVGIGLYEVRHVVIRELTVQGFQLDGVNAHDSAFDVTLQALTCRGNGRSGVSVGGSCRVTIQNCLIGNNGTAQVRTEGYSHTRIIDCDLIEGGAPTLVKKGGEVTVIGATPQSP